MRHHITTLEEFNERQNHDSVNFDGSKFFQKHKFSGIPIFRYLHT